MNVLSQRVDTLPTYAVGHIAERKRQLVAEGVDVIDLGAGDADLAPPDVAVEALHQAVQERRMSRYPFQIGSLDFRDAVTRFMERRFGVTVDRMTEIVRRAGAGLPRLFGWGAVGGCGRGDLSPSAGSRLLGGVGRPA
jgi:LL-diaminopimelate aminotransferase